MQNMPTGSKQLVKTTTKDGMRWCFITVSIYSYFMSTEQVKLAERVKASEIPLPKLPQSQMGLITSDIPLPPGGYAKGILKKSLG